MRIALGGIFTESNHLAGRLTTLADFERTELRRGEEVLAATGGVLGGMLAELRRQRATVLPLLFASAVPGGPITRACYDLLKRDLLDRLDAVLPVDGVLLPLHGAAAVEELGSLDEDLAVAVRARTGGAVPVIATLDCHAHVTGGLAANTDALLAWDTYPHRDTFETGERGARLLAKTLSGAARPAMAVAKVPVIVGGFCGSTDEGPFAEVMRHAKSLEGSRDVLSTSALLVQPHLDLPGMGGGGIVVTNGNEELAVAHAESLARMYWDRRFALEPRMWTPAEAIAEGLRVPGTVLLLETADCSGGGAAGDSVAAIRALIQAEVRERSLAPVVDPEAASVCHAAGEGASVTLDLGHSIDRQWGKPLRVTGQVERLSDGRFVYSGGIWKGQTGEMGPAAVLRAGEVRILITASATYDWADEQFRCVGLDPSGAKFLVVKNPMNYRVGYADQYRAAFVLDTPGPTCSSLRHVQFRKLARPYFPADADIPGLRPTVHRGHRLA